LIAWENYMPVESETTSATAVLSALRDRLKACRVQHPITSVRCRDCDLFTTSIDAISQLLVDVKFARHALIAVVATYEPYEHVPAGAVALSIAREALRTTMP